MNMVSNVLPFHNICDWAANPLPFTVSKKEFKSPGTASGMSDVTWAGGIGPGQLSKATNVVQVSQPDKSTAKNTTERMRTTEEVLARGEYIPTSLFRISEIIHLTGRLRRSTHGLRSSRIFRTSLHAGPLLP